LSTRKVGRWAAAVGATAAVLGAQVLVQLAGAAPASAAVPGYQIVSATSVLDSATYKSVTANCPAGKRVIGTGFQLLGAQGDIVLDDLIPTATGVTVGAGEDQDGTAATWKITAIAVCATAPAGIEIVTVTSAFGVSTGKNATANCPAGKRVIGTGAALANGFGQVSVGNLIFSDTAVFAYGIDDQDGYSAGWSITAYAVCANPLAGLETKTAASAYDSSTQKLVSANCSAGKKALGQGWGMGGDGQALVTYFGIGDTGVTHIGNEDDDGFSGNWGINPAVICATA
jgi:hypothetical protein